MSPVSGESKTWGYMRRKRGGMEEIDSGAFSEVELAGWDVGAEGNAGTKDESNLGNAVMDSSVIRKGGRQARSRAGGKVVSGRLVLWPEDFVLPCPLSHGLSGLASRQWPSFFPFPAHGANVERADGV